VSEAVADRPSSSAARAASPPVLEVVELGKRFFHRSHRRATTLQERCIGRDQERGPGGEFWGLRHVTFSVPRGTTTAVIGANGAGKSTLLRLVCGIGRPDEGEIRVAGRLHAMLDLDAGFHNELTGRENVFVSAMIAGLRRRQVAALMDEIVAFSGLEAFVDDPLRTYSSGMRARLGFAVAVAVMQRTDLLLIDEVLSVGDAEFGARCLERIAHFRAAGGTVLVVSHSLPFVAEFCDKALWLHGGHLADFGDATAVVSRYQTAGDHAPRC